MTKHHKEYLPKWMCDNDFVNTEFANFLIYQASCGTKIARFRRNEDSPAFTIVEARAFGSVLDPHSLKQIEQQWLGWLAAKQQVRKL